MRDYEIVYIFRSTFSPEEIESKLEPYHALITAGGGEITAVVQWGKRQLAYPIDKQTTGHYVVAQFTAEPDRLAELERVLKLQDDLIRYLVVLSEGELPLPETMHQSREVVGADATAPAAEGEGPAAEGGEASAAEAPEKPEKPEKPETPETPVAEAGAVEDVEGEGEEAAAEDDAADDDTEAVDAEKADGDDAAKGEA